MRTTISIYLAYFAQFLKSRMAYKGDFIASIFANMMVTGMGFLFIVLLVDGKTIPDLRGWSREEVLFIYGYSMISMAIFSALAPNLYSFGDRYIIQGEFDRVLLRPLNSLAQVLFESFNLEATGSFLLGVGVIVYSMDHLALEFTGVDFLWLMLSSLSGATILLFTFVFLCSMSFHFEDRMGIAPPFYNVIQFGRYPLPIYNEAIQFILRWVVPFGFVAFYPATHFLNRPGFEFFCYFTPCMAIVVATFALISWKFGVSKYASTGN